MNCILLALLRVHRRIVHPTIIVEVTRNEDQSRRGAWRQGPSRSIRVLGSVTENQKCKEAKPLMEVSNTEAGQGRGGAHPRGNQMPLESRKKQGCLFGGLKGGVWESGMK